jgi:hypothetical protein
MTETADATLAAGVRCAACNYPLDATNADGAPCPACFERSLREVDAEFLDNYAGFGARSRIVVAEACLRALVLSDVADRKLLAIQVYDQFVAAASDLIGLYFALMERRATPITRAILGFQLDVPRAVTFFDNLLSLGPMEMLAGLGLPHPEQVEALAGALDRRERRQVREALQEALGDLDRLGDFQAIGEHALVGAANRLRGPMALAERSSWLPGGKLGPGQVAAVALDEARRGVEINVLSTDEETLGAVVDGIDVMTRLVRNLIFAFVSLHGPAQFRSGFRAE